MLQVFSNNSSEISINSKNPKENVDMINEHIKLCNCKYMTVDITDLNIMDACMVSTLCSTAHYMKYPEGKINWIINSAEVKDYTSSMNLGNCEFLVK